MFACLAARLDGLRRRYAEPHRAYHTEAHIQAMLQGAARLAHDLSAPCTVELAIWYHDAIYDPAATDNEAQSAVLLRQDIAGLADPALIDEAAAMILATASHELPQGLAPSRRQDCALFLDLDMAVLGGDRSAFDAYEQGIAAEYIPVYGETRYREGRRDFLGRMLARPRLFLTDHFHDQLDASARANLRRVLGS